MTALGIPRTESPIAASILALLQGIERHGPDAPASIAFRTALRKKGQEAQAAGGSEALDLPQRDVATADPSRAEARAAVLAAAWSDLLPGSAGWVER